MDRREFLSQRSMTLLALFPGGIPELLREPGYNVDREGDRWVVRKSRPGGGRPFTISAHPDRTAAEQHRKALPRLRLSGLFVRFDPAACTRTVIADWTAEEDAREIDLQVRAILNRYAPAGPRALLRSTPVYMARLFGATGHTAEESGHPARFAIYLDPFRATGRLHAAATLIHEAAHVERYRARGFHANRAAAVLPKRDFVLLGLADELAAYRAEASLVKSFLDDPANAEVRRVAGEAMLEPDLRWPLALTAMLGFGGPAHPSRRAAEARRQVVLDLARVAGGYWESRHTDPLDPALRHTIRTWRHGSPEWKAIAAERSGWSEAEGELSPAAP